MTVARDRSAWGRNVEYRSYSFIHESQQTLNETRTIFDKLAWTVDLTARKETTTTVGVVYSTAASFSIFMQLIVRLVFITLIHAGI
jgi:hypothetical protein